MNGGKGNIANLKITLHIIVFETEYEVHRNMSYIEIHDQRNGFWTSRSREVASWFSGSGCVPYHKGRGFESRLVQYFVVILDYGEKDGKTQYFLSTGPYFKTSKKGQKLHKFISKGQWNCLKGACDDDFLFRRTDR